MNIENISALAAQLQLLGFDNASSGLLKRICFKPETFVLTQRFLKAGDQFIFNLFFEKSNQENSYHLNYYDATLQKETVPAYTEMNGVNLVELESMMTDLDWKSAFDLDVKKQWAVADKTSWDKEQKVEAVVNALEELETSEEGKSAATSLKLKYWAGMPYQEMFGTVMPVKSRSEVSQRFYFSDGQPGISVDEALRFLQNRWLEKQMQVKKKTADVVQVSEEAGEGQASPGSGLLKKKRFNGIKGGKKNSMARK